MKPSLQFSIPCLDIVSNGSGAQSLQNIFFELPIGASFPYKLSYFYIANCWCSGVGKYRQNLRILNPDGSVLVDSGAQPVELEAYERPYMIANRLENLRFTTTGYYKVQISLDDELVLEYSIKVFQAQAQP